MEAQVTAALKASNYKQAAKLLKQWQAQDPQSPLLRLYAGQLQEQTNRPEAAEKNYLKLLKQTPNSKIMNQARAGIERIARQREHQKAAALSQAKTVSGGDEIAVLAIATPPEASRAQAIQGVANIFNLDAYTARMKVPSSGFRLHRIGSWGEINYYQKALGQTNVPTLSAKISHIKTLQTFQVCYFEALTPQPAVICKNAEGQLGKIEFTWAEVSQRVSGQLPIFEQVVDIGNWGKTVHKEKVQDYVQVVDLHLKEREIVVRLCDRLYQYQKSTPLSTTADKAGSHNKLNSRIQWNHLLTHLNQSIESPHHSDFTRFGKGALEFINLLPPIHPNLDIDRRAPSHWDQAFHLYSSLCYFNN